LAAGNGGEDMTNLAGQGFSVQEPSELSIIIVNWNTRDLLRDCLNSVYSETRATSFEVFVVDNASSDSSVEMVKKEFPQVRLIENQENLGFAKANNQAIKQNSGQYVLLLNPDTVVLSGALDKMVAFMRAHPAVDASGPMILNDDGSSQVSTLDTSYMFESGGLFLLRGWLATYLLGLLVRKLGKRGTYSPHPRQVFALIGACMMMTREAVDKVGLLDEQYFFYSEDIDWFYRLKQLGGKAYFIPEVQIIHYGAQSMTQIITRSKYYYQSKYLFTKKHHGKMAAYLFRIMVVIDSFVVICAFLLLQALVKRDRRKERNWRLRCRWQTLLWAVRRDKGGSN